MSHCDSPPVNAFGVIYPSFDQDRLRAVLRIDDRERVLDAGGGHNPFRRADVIVDFDMRDGVHRDGGQVPEDLKDRYVVADIQALPFRDGAFDFIFCSHVLEHVPDPERACRELMRVGKRGYIETPRKWTELVAGYPSHRWLVELVDGELVFEERGFIEAPYLSTLLHSVWKHGRLHDNALRHYLNVSCVQLYWERTFRFRVIRTGNGAFDYSDRRQAALAHFHFAKNILLLGAPPEHGLYHAEKCAALCPEKDAYWALCGAYALTLDNGGLRDRSLGLLRERGLIGRTDVLLARAGLKGALMKKLLRMVEHHESSGKD